MGNLYVDTDILSQQQAQFRSITQTLSQISSDLNTIQKNLNWNDSISSSVRHRITQYSNYTNQLQQKTNYLSSALVNIFQEYNSTEHSLSQVDTDGHSQWMQDHTDSVENEDSRFLAILKSLLQWMDKTDTNDEGGITKDWISYLESLYSFFTGDIKGLTGAEDWFDLADNSISLWSGFYEYLKGFYNNVGNLFSTENQQKVAGLGIVAGMFGLFSSLFGCVDTIQNSNDIGAAGIIGEVLGLGDDAVDIWSSIETLKRVGDTTTEGGIYSPLSLYSSIAKGYLSAFSQGFKSFEKYMADGSWDLGDTGSTGVESAVAGLYSMISALSFGLISEKTTGMDAEDVSAGLENWAKDIGTRTGQYIANDLELNEKYQHANGMEKVALTFYAAFCSR